MPIGDYLRLMRSLEADAEGCGGNFGRCQTCTDVRLFITEAEKLRQAAKDAFDEGYERGCADVEEGAEGLISNPPDSDAEDDIEAVKSLVLLDKFFARFAEFMDDDTPPGVRLLESIEACRANLAPMLAGGPPAGSPEPNTTAPRARYAEVEHARRVSEGHRDLLNAELKTAYSKLTAMQRTLDALSADRRKENFELKMKLEQAEHALAQSQAQAQAQADLADHVYVGPTGDPA